jgi:3-hydroxybenzoate/4-hydroxybenzoate---CoA ligase
MNAAEYLLGAAALERHGTRTALVCGNEQVSFAQLGASIGRASAAWTGLGARAGDRVLILMRDGPECAAAWLGALHAGAVAIAVNGKLAVHDLRYMFEDSGARLFLAETESLPLVAGFAGERCVDLRTWREALANASPIARALEARPDDPAFWLYSSGTTGAPKGIVHAHKDIVPAGKAMRDVLGLTAGDTVFGTSKLFFAYGLEHALLGPLSIGATSVLHPETVEAGIAADLVYRHRPAAFFSVPSFYRRLLALPADALAPFAKIRHFVAAGERLPARVQQRWRAAAGGEILALYGMSETFCVALMTPPGAAADGRTGLPVAGVETRLVDDTGQPPRPGEPGVLWVRHPSLASGYANRVEATRQHFVEGWFCTNDVFVRQADGYFFHQGRADEFIKIAGQWVQPSELEEAALAGGSIAEAACVRVNDADGFERLALFVTSGADPQAAVAEAARACERGLPRHKRPKWIRSVPELPRTATGKVQRFKLRELMERELAG